MQQPPFYRGTTLLLKGAQRATPPLLCHRVDENLLTYTAASPPRTHELIHGPTPPVGGTYYHWRRAAALPHLCTPRRASSFIYKPEQLIHT
ncbi:hypothetical protein AVEN_153604-1 [Araneus ventricosus]|uniref:Uncharacterized protein n=1 Tax=Araneus ventricosus TaxID=182803 RepID=A0A4Y2BRL1_ARAVE|nr:hypothetical protein AVEN_153604-1 [Araneus ventricosus]